MAHRSRSLNGEFFNSFRRRAAVLARERAAGSRRGSAQAIAIADADSRQRAYEVGGAVKKGNEGESGRFCFGNDKAKVVIDLLY